MNNLIKQPNPVSTYLTQAENSELVQQEHDVREILRQCSQSDVASENVTAGDEIDEPLELTGNFIIQIPGVGNKTFDLAAISKSLQRGEIDKTFKIRPEGGTKGEEATVGDVVAANFSLKVLYEPMWAHIGRGFSYGALAGIALKLLDTTIMLFTADPTGASGIVFLIVMGSIYLTRYFSLAPLVAVFISIQLGFTVNFFVMFLGAAFIGGLFGGPLGALIGAIIGFIRKNHIPKAPDSEPEGRSPYIWGMLTPAVFLAISVPLYLFWLMPKVIEWISNGQN